MKKPAIHFVSDAAFTGHGNVAEGYARILRSIGFDTGHSALPAGDSPGTAAASLQPGTILIQCLIPPRLQPLEPMLNIALVFHEWSRMPAAWADELNRFQRVWTSSRYNTDVLRHSGYHGPVDQLPALLKPESFAQKTSWYSEAPFRFLSVGEWHFRKGYHLLAESFSRAFAPEEEVELHIKTGDTGGFGFDDSRISIISGRLSDKEMRCLYAGYDAYVTTSLAEGLGLPVGEAMASGLPVAAVNWSGLTEFTGEGRSLDLPFRLVDQPYCSRPDYYAPGQQCALIELDGTAAVLRAMAGMGERGRRSLADRARSHIEKRFSGSAVEKALQSAIAAVAGE